MKFKFGFASVVVFALLLSVAAIQAAAQDVHFVGTWEMNMAAGGPGGGGGGGGNRGGGGGGPRTLTITRNGDKFSVTHKSPRGESTYDATVSGNTIAWTENHADREGAARKIEYKATVDGDTMKGTMSGGQNSREFTAKRGS